MQIRQGTLIDFSSNSIKIEKFSTYCLTDPYERYKLSEDEIGYCERFVNYRNHHLISFRYQEIVTKCHNDSFLNSLPEEKRSLTDDEMSNIPSLMFNYQS